MANYFLESSAFVKRYKEEKGTNFINKLFQEEHQLYYLNLSILEIRKTFYRLSSGIDQSYPKITETKLRSLESRFAADLLKMKRIAFTEEIIEKGVEIVKQGIKQRIWVKSSFDVAQIASYLIAKEIHTDLTFVCSDCRTNVVKAAEQFVDPKYVVVPEKQEPTDKES